MLVSNERKILPRLLMNAILEFPFDIHQAVFNFVEERLTGSVDFSDSVGYMVK
jgi:hypothetical protein